MGEREPDAAEAMAWPLRAWGEAVAEPAEAPTAMPWVGGVVSVLLWACATLMALQSL